MLERNIENWESSQCIKTIYALMLKHKAFIHNIKKSWTGWPRMDFDVCYYEYVQTFRFDSEDGCIWRVY